MTHRQLRAFGPNRHSLGGAFQVDRPAIGTVGAFEWNQSDQRRFGSSIAGQFVQLFRFGLDLFAKPRQCPRINRVRILLARGDVGLIAQFFQFVLQPLHVRFDLR